VRDPDRDRPGRARHQRIVPHGRRPRHRRPPAPPSRSPPRHRPAVSRATHSRPARPATVLRHPRLVPRHLAGAQAALVHPGGGSRCHPIASWAICTAVVPLRLVKPADRYCKVWPEAAMPCTVKQRHGLRSQVRSQSRMGQLWPNTIRLGLLSARPEFPCNNHAAHGRYGQILVTEISDLESDR
jgi:hypothetical protein